jgi:uncharacterized protein (DUF1499 family)
MNLPRPLSIALGLLLVTGVIGVFVWWLVRSVRRSEEPGKLICKWVVAVVLLAGLLFLVSKTVGQREGAYIVPSACVAFAVIMSVLWAPSLGALVARPFTSLFDGGVEELKPQAFYSIAIAKRKRGKYQEAIYEIQRQLARFPQDAVGQMMLAEIQAENLNDLPGAQNTIERLCQERGHAPQSIAMALYQLADWHLKYSRDVEAARAALEKIVTLLPDTEQAQVAAQRIAHLGSREALLATDNRTAIPMPRGVDNVGLLKDSSELQKAPQDPAAIAGEYVKHLEEYPLDNEAREKLALIYADHYQRLDLAVGELEQLVQAPNQPAKQVERWLNLIADIQIKHAADYEAARETLQRIVDLFPGLPPAENARQRLGRLKLELKGKEKSQAIKLGSYEQNIGLKKR